MAQTMVVILLLLTFYESFSILSYGTLSLAKRKKGKYKKMQKETEYESMLVLVVILKTVILFVRVYKRIGHFDLP